MKLSDVELPSNRKFGFFFCMIFAALGVYSYLEDRMIVAFLFFGFSLLFLFITLVKADTLLPLNKLWMQFGFLLGMIVSPIVLGIIFFGLFTPIGIVMRLFGRDELRLKFKKKKQSYWIVRGSVTNQEDNFKNQF